MLEKATAMKRFEYSPLGEELKAQTSAAEKPHQKLEKVFDSYKKEEKNLKSCAESKSHNIKEFYFIKESHFYLLKKWFRRD